MVDLFDKKFVVVAGKGGVGRTTVSMMLGLCAAARGKRTLICLASAPLRYTELLGGVAVGNEEHQISDRLSVINLDPISSREEYGLKVLRNRTVHRLVFGSRIVSSFLDAVPGLAEWAMLGKASHYVLPQGEEESVYDLVIFDSPATGHGLDVLSLPRAIVASVPTGRIRDEALARVELLEDPDSCEVIPVTIPEEMPVNEVVELVQALKRRSLPVERMVVNMVASLDADREVEDMIDGANGIISDWMLPSAVELSRRRVRDASFVRLEDDIALPLIKIGSVFGGVDEASLVRLARRLNRQI